MNDQTMESARNKLQALVREKMAATKAAGAALDERTARSAAQCQLEWDLKQESDAGDAESGELLKLMENWGSDPAERAARLLGALPVIESPKPKPSRFTGGDGVTTLTGVSN